MEEKKILTSKQKGVNRHWKNFLDKDYLGSHNLEKGEEMLLTIEKFVGEEEVNSQEGKKTKQVLYFKENVPKMILNITNGNTLSNLYGSHPDQWVGRQIQIYATPVKAFGKTQDALRIRDFIPKKAINEKEYIDKIKKCIAIEQLVELWESLPRSAKANENVLKTKEEMKNVLTNI